MSPPSIEKQYEEIKNYYEKVFFGYVRSDLKYLLNHDLDDNEFGGCSVPLAMVVLSSINQLGYLTSNKKADRKETEYYIKQFCNDWMGRIDKLFEKETFQKMLVHFYRHGMAHQFLPIHSIGITRNQEQKKILEFGSKGIYCVIHAKILADNFIKALDLVYKRIKISPDNDKEFIRRFYTRLQEQITNYEDKNADLKDKVEKRLKPKGQPLYPFGTTGTTISGTDPSVTA